MSLIIWIKVKQDMWTESSWHVGMKGALLSPFVQEESTIQRVGDSERFGQNFWVKRGSVRSSHSPNPNNRSLLLEGIGKREDYKEPEDTVISPRHNRNYSFGTGYEVIRETTKGTGSGCRILCSFLKPTDESLLHIQLHLINITITLEAWETGTLLPLSNVINVMKM
jgi:hypothetical protein